MSDNISYYELLQPVRYKYKANIFGFEYNFGGKYSNSVFLYSVSALLVVNYQIICYIWIDYH